MAEPSTERLSSPSGTPLAAFTWADVRSRLAGSETYLLATSGRGGGPHVVPVLGVWLERAVCRFRLREGEGVQCGPLALPGRGRAVAQEGSDAVSGERAADVGEVAAVKEA